MTLSSNPEREVCIHNRPINWSCDSCGTAKVRSLHTHHDGIWMDCLECLWKERDVLLRAVRELREAVKLAKWKELNDMDYHKDELEILEKALASTQQFDTEEKEKP